MDITEILPEDVLFLVYSFLDVEELMMISAVSTQWRSLASSNKLWKAIYQAHSKKIPLTKFNEALAEDKNAIQYYWKKTFKKQWLDYKRKTCGRPAWKGNKYVTKSTVKIVSTSTRKTKAGIPLHWIRDDSKGWFYDGNDVGVPVQGHPKAKDWFYEDPQCPICHKKKLNILWTIGSVANSAFDMDDVVELEMKCTVCSTYFYLDYDANALNSMDGGLFA